MVKVLCPAALCTRYDKEFVDIIFKNKMESPPTLLISLS